MNYSKIIEKYLIDFDELEVGQQIWSVEFGTVEVSIAQNIKGTEKIAVKIKEGHSFVGNFHNHLFFTSNPFENLQTIEPVENLEVEAEKYAETQFYDSLEELKNIERAFKSGAYFAQKSTKKEVEREVLVKQYKNEDYWVKRKLILFHNNLAYCESGNILVGWKFWKEIEPL